MRAPAGLPVSANREFSMGEEDRLAAAYTVQVTVFVSGWTDYLGINRS